MSDKELDSVWEQAQRSVWDELRNQAREEMPRSYGPVRIHTKVVEQSLYSRIESFIRRYL